MYSNEEMKKREWLYYNHVIIPAIAPHKNVDLSLVTSGRIWEIFGGGAFLVRWTENFDCEVYTNWWYIIKDTPFDISTLKSKRRYEINKGNRNFEVKRINIECYRDDMFKVQQLAYQGWPQKYRPNNDRTAFDQMISDWEDKIIYGGFDRESGTLAAYAMLTEHAEYVEFNVLRAIPAFESKGINAAMVFKIVTDYEEFISNVGYILDGSRSINHETAFQDYLEKYFAFRKAYCDLRIKYRRCFGMIISCLWPFRHLLKKMDKIGIIHKANAILRMEEIVREDAVNK